MLKKIKIHQFMFADRLYFLFNDEMVWIFSINQLNSYILTEKFTPFSWNWLKSVEMINVENSRKSWY